ncbi:MAG: alpha/beta hydrolase fold domain-containing protein [Mycetocola sp.]
MKRAQLAQTMQGLLAGIEVRDDTVTGRETSIPVRWYRGEEAPVASLLWVHGGAFSGGGLDQLESHAVAAALAHHKIHVVTVDYRRVPSWSPFRDQEPAVLDGTRYPAPLNDVSDVLASVIPTAAATYIGGASAGACLSAATALRAITNGGRAPAGVVLAYGTFHADLPSLPESVRSRVRGRHGIVQFRSATVRRMNYNYAGSVTAMSDPFAFPGGHDLSRFPPALVLDADRDTLRASGELFATELRGAGATVSRRTITDSTHGFFDRPTQPSFAAAISEIAVWISTETARVRS